MKRLWWIVRAAWYLRGLFGWWRPTDLLYCLDKAAACYDSYGNDYARGTPKEEIDEDVRTWYE